MLRHTAGAPDVLIRGWSAVDAQPARPEFHNSKAKLVQESLLMFGFRSSARGITVVLLAVFFASGVGAARAQSTRRSRRESNANRKARIERTVQETYSHRYEVAGGGGFMRFRSGEFQQKNSQVTFWMNGTYFLNPRLGIIGEIRGAYGNAKIGNLTENSLPFKPQISEYPFMGGATYRVYAKEKMAVSVFAEGGAALGKFAGDSKGLTEAQIGVWNSGTRPAFSVGASFDYNFYPDLAVRITPTYLGTNFGGTLQNSLGVNAGIVYRFGHIR
jgi:hypothetical protein